MPDPDPSPAPQKTPGFTPFSGCFMFLLMIGVILVLGAWSLYTLFQQNRIIDTFAQPQSVPTTVASFTPEEKQVVEAKKTAFFEALSKKEEGRELRLTVAELNQWIACQEAAAEWRGVVHFTGTDSAQSLLFADVCMKLNGLPWAKTFRYFVGQARFSLACERDPNGETIRLQLRMMDLSAPGKTVDPGFVAGLREHHWLYQYFEDPKLGPLFYRITDAKVTADGIVLTSGQSHNKK